MNRAITPEGRCPLLAGNRSNVNGHEAPALAADMNNAGPRFPEARRDAHLELDGGVA